MADEWGARVWAVSWQGAALCAGVWLLTVLLRARLSPSLRGGLWLLVCAKFVFGLCWAAPVTLRVLPARHLVVAPAAPPQVIWNAPQARKEAPRPPILGEAVRKSVQIPIPPELGARGRSPSRAATAFPVLFLLWLAGCLVITLAETRQWLKVRRLTQRAIRPVPDALGAELAALAVTMGVKRLPRLALSPEVAAPLVTGIGQPTILLPVDVCEALNTQERAMALAHELAHLRRGDLWLATLPALARALFFFHPLAWLASREWLLAREEACDALALYYTNGGRAGYGGLLLRLASPRPAVCGAAGFSAAYFSLRRRLRAIAEFHPARRFSAALGLSLCLMCGLVFVPWRLAAQPLILSFRQTFSPSLPKRYALSDLGVTGGRSSYAAAINNLGMVVADVLPRRRGRQAQAFLWQAGSFTRLAKPPAYRHSLATGLNNRGQVIASSYNYSPFHHAFVWDGAAQPLDSSGGYPFSKALGINDAGQVAGWVQTGRRDARGLPQARASVWDNGARHDLNALGGDNSYAYAISASGLVAGKADLPSGTETHAVLWDGAGPTDLGTLGGRNSVAYSVNESGQAVGASDTFGGTRHAAFWNAGQIQDLGTLPGDTESVAHRLNAGGWIVGMSQNAQGHSHAVLWQGGRIVDLNTYLLPSSGWTLEDARGLNDRGQIVGQGRFHGQPRAFLLTPGA